MTIAVSAPGKLVLLGEYAVLLGHPALVAAVDRRARVRVEPADGDAWSAAAPGLQREPVEFTFDDGGFEWRSTDGDAVSRLRLVETILSALLASGLVDPAVAPAATLDLDTREFFERSEGGSGKLGIGSSAALTVALTDAVRRWCSTPTQTGASLDVEVLLELHRSFQGGRGSGIDLAAARLGGVVEYRLADGGSRPVATALELPDGLHVVFIWTGSSASTSSFLARLDAGMRTEGAAIGEVLARLGANSARGLASLRGQRIDDFLAAVDDFARAMDDLGRAAAMPVLSDEHVVLRRLAGDCGVVYKPSGAGGGDVGVGFTDDTVAARTFARRARDAGFQPLGLSIDPTGLETTCCSSPIHNS